MLLYKCLIYLQCNFKTTMRKELSEDEWELIDMIRNYNNTYPKSIELEIYIQMLVDKLMDI